jgi:hypothetical protein
MADLCIPEEQRTQRFWSSAISAAAIPGFLVYLGTRNRALNQLEKNSALGLAAITFVVNTYWASKNTAPK